MVKKTDLSPAEFRVMDVLWRKGSATAREIQAALASDRKLARTTISTLLSRMREKGHVEAEEKDFAYVFRPLIDREQVVRRKIDDLLDTVLGGDLAPLAMYIARNRHLNPEQVKALDEMIASKEEGDKK